MSERAGGGKAGARPEGRAVKLTRQQEEGFAEVLIFILHARNLIEGPHPLRAEAVEATEILKEALGAAFDRLYETKSWKRGEVGNMGKWWDRKG